MYDKPERSADKLVNLPSHILKDAHSIINILQSVPVIDPFMVILARSIFDDIEPLAQKQQIFLDNKQHLRKAVEDSRGMPSDYLADTISSILKSRQAYDKYLTSCRNILSDLITISESLLGRLQILTQHYADMIAGEPVQKYVARQLSVYRAFKAKYDECKKTMNCRRWESAPGAAFGLEPFKDIALAWDGTMMVWEDEIDDWTWLDHFHPCRYMPGSDWGKFTHDLTNGEFWANDARAALDWNHASPAKHMFDQLKEAHREAAQGTPATNAWREANLRAAAETGIPYPVAEESRLLRRTYDVDVGKVVSEKFAPSNKGTHCFEELNSKVQEVVVGGVSIVPGAQEHEEVIFTLSS